MTDATETRPILLVCGCQKYRPYLEKALVRFAHPEWVGVGIVGDPTLSAPRREGNIIVLPVPDTYEALPTKIHAAMSWVANTYPSTIGVWKTDDDILYHDINTVLAAIKLHHATPYWGLFVGRCREAPVNMVRIAVRFDDTSLRPRHQQAIYCYGHGYWISREALPLIVAAEKDYRESFLEDVCTGYVMNRNRWIPHQATIPYRELPRGPELLALQ